MILKLYRIDIEASRKSFRIWTNLSNNKYSLFKRIKDIVNEFNIYFDDDNLCDNPEFDINDTDYKELILSIKWMKQLCKNNSKWQNYLSFQDNATPNQNIVSSIIELFRRSLTKSHHSYIIDLQFVIVRFIIENVNGTNEDRIKEYSGSRILDYASEIVQKGVLRLEASHFEFRGRISAKGKAGRKSLEFNDLLVEYRKSFVECNRNKDEKLIFTSNHKYQILIQQVLVMINSMIIPETEHQFINKENHKLMNNLLKLNYMQYKTLKFDRYSPDLFDPNSKISKMFNIQVGFQTVYLIAKLFGNNGQECRNSVQRIDTESIPTYYYRLLRGMMFEFNCCKSKYKPKNERQYNKYKSEDAFIKPTMFFDGYSSSIEIVMTDGRLITKYFPILPCFLPFTQTEKDIFWVDANLDNSKTCVNSFMEFANDKIDELFAQQDVQKSFFSIRDTAKKSNWLTDIISLLILILNFCLFFSLEINDGEILENPSLFGTGKKATGAVLGVLGFTILILLLYLFVLQSWIMCILQNKRKDSWYKKTYEGGYFWRFLRFIYYVWKNTEQTFQARNIWCYIFCIVFSFLGIFSNFFWFAFTMTYLVIFSPQILEVTSAVWLPKKRIFSTVILSAIILYWFAIIAYVYFGKDFNTSVGDSHLNMRRTLIVIFDSWYKFGLGGFLADNGSPSIKDESDNFQMKGSRIVFDFLFFFVVPTLLLSIISGIIIDTFVERRANSDSISERQNDQCFVCGKKANELPEFVKHCKFEHNLWDYMFYIGYLRSKNAEDLQDYRDIHVRKCLDNNDNDWFPAYQDFVKAKHEQKILDKKNKKIDYSPPKIDMAAAAAAAMGAQQNQEAAKQPENAAQNMSAGAEAKINPKIDDLEKKINSKVDTMKNEMNAKIDSLGGRMDSLDSKLDMILSKLSS